MQAGETDRETTHEAAATAAAVLAEPGPGRPAAEASAGAPSRSTQGSLSGEREERDSRIAAAVRAALGAYMDFRHVEAASTGAVVHLTGAVRTQAGRLSAAVVAHVVPGVRRVRNDIRVDAD